MNNVKKLTIFYKKFILHNKYYLFERLVQKIPPLHMVVDNEVLNNFDYFNYIGM